MNPQQRKLWVSRMGARTGWWDRRREAIIEPDREIVDAHFHLWDERSFPDPQDGGMLRTSRYLLEEFLRGTSGGHRVVQVVYIECGSGYLPDGPDHLRPVGETEFAREMARRLTDDNNATGSMRSSPMPNCAIRTSTEYSMPTRKWETPKFAQSARARPGSKTRPRACWPAPHRPACAPTGVFGAAWRGSANAASCMTPSSSISSSIN